MTIDSVPVPPRFNDLLIQGAPVLVYITMSETQVDAAHDVENFMKVKLTELLVKEILKNNLCEFTKEKNMNEFTVTYRARAYLTPKDQVKILRENKKL